MGAESIKVHVAGAGPVRQYVAAGIIEVPPGTTTRELMARFDIPAGMKVICMIGRTRRPPSAVLRDGDSVTMVSLMAGG